MITGLPEVQEELKEDRLSMSFALADLPKPWRMYFVLSFRSLLAQEAIRLRIEENPGHQPLPRQIQDPPRAHRAW